MPARLNASRERVIEGIRQLVSRRNLDGVIIDLNSYPPNIIVGRTVAGMSRRVLIYPDDPVDPRDPRIEYLATWFADVPEATEGKMLGDLDHILEWSERFLIELEDWTALSPCIRAYAEKVFR